MAFSFYVPDPTTPATFRNPGPLGAGRMQVLGSNLTLLQTQNARRILRSHPGIAGWSATATGGFGLAANVQWGLPVKSGGSAICLGDVILPSPYPSSPNMPGLILTMRARVRSMGATAGLVFVATVGDGSVEYGAQIGTAVLAISNTSFEYVALGIGCPAGATQTVPWTPEAFTPVPHGSSAITDQGSAYRCTLWVGGYVTTGYVDTLGITVYQTSPAETPPAPHT